MATACVKLIESGGELSNIIIDNLDDPVKVAVKDGDKYTVKDSNEIQVTEFEKNHLFVEINAATPAAGEQPVDSNAAGEQPVDSNAAGEQPFDSNAAGEQPFDSNAAAKTETTENVEEEAAKAAEEEIVDPIPSYEENIQNMSGRLKRGGKSSRKGRKYTRKGRKYTRKGRKPSKNGRKSSKNGRKSSKNGGKTAKRGRNGKGSRRSKK